MGKMMGREGNGTSSPDGYDAAGWRVGVRGVVRFLVVVLLGVQAVNAQEPLIEYPGAKSLSVGFSVYWPEKRYLPYDSAGEGRERSEVSADAGLLLKAVYRPEERSFFSDCLMFTAVELFAVRDRDGDMTHVVNTQYGVGYSFADNFLLRMTHNENLFQGDFDDSGRLYWTGLSMLLGPSVVYENESLSVLADMECYFFPPHNEYDPNPGVAFQDRVTARYAVDTHMRVKFRKHSDSGVFARCFLPLGDSHPQVDYNYRADLVSVSWWVGFDLAVRRGLSWRVYYSSEEDLGGLEDGHRPLDYSAVMLAYVF